MGISIQGGNTVRFSIQFTHQGDAYNTGKVRVVIGKDRGSFDEMVAKVHDLGAIEAHVEATVVTKTFDLPIPSDIVSIWTGPPSNYSLTDKADAYVKIYDVPGYSEASPLLAYSDRGIITILEGQAPDPDPDPDAKEEGGMTTPLLIGGAALLGLMIVSGKK